MRNVFVGLALLGALTACSEEAAPPVEAAFTEDPATVFINELHYDNDGTDVGEAVEVAGPAGTDLAGWQLVLYNGSGGAPYNTRTLAGVIPDQQGGFGTLALEYPSNGVQNGSPDGVALVDAAGETVQFLSYEGSFTAVGGPADGLASTDLGVAEGSSTTVGSSLQLKGAGTTYQGFTWSPPSAASFGAVNTGQTFGEGGDGGGGGPVAACGDPATLISAVQGSGDASPQDGSAVTVEGIVVGDFQDDAVAFSDLGGFYVQEEAADEDGDPATSEGVFVFAPNAADVSQGDLVRATGTVDEFGGLTELTNVTGVEVCGAAPLPAPTDVTLPLASQGALERLEGMRVRLPQDLVISEYFNFDRFGEIVLTLPLGDLGRPYQPTSYVEPGPAATEIEQANALRRITLDDGRSEQNPDPARHPNGEAFTLDNRFRGGDTVGNTVGVLDDRFGLYRVQPTEGADYTSRNPRPEEPEAVGGSLRVASFNVLNYFTDLGERGADTQEEFERQAAKIVAALATINADVFGLIEIQNNGSVAVSDLVRRLNEAVGAGTYTFIETGTLGTDEIKVAFIYKPSAVTPVGDYAVLDSSVDPRFDTARNRPALAQTFEDGAGGVFTAVINHFKSKGSGCGAGDDDPQQGNCNGTRERAAQALVDWLATDPTGSGDPDTLILGDLNAYDEEDPIDRIKAGADDTSGTGDDYTDLVERYGGEFAYSYLFNTQFGHLDYALANRALLGQVTGTTEWHINADEPDLLDYDTTFKQDAQDALYQPNPYRSSDHDPVVVGLALTVPSPEERLERLVGAVEALADETLSTGEANALLAQLEAAQRHLARGREDLAAGALVRFERLVRSYIGRGSLTADEGEPLLNASAAIRRAL